MSLKCWALRRRRLRVFSQLLVSDKASRHTGFKPPHPPPRSDSCPHATTVIIIRPRRRRVAASIKAHSWCSLKAKLTRETPTTSVVWRERRRGRGLRGRWQILTEQPERKSARQVPRGPRRTSDHRRGQLLLPLWNISAHERSVCSLNPYRKRRNNAVHQQPTRL